MVFSSVTFLFYFLPATLALYYLLPWRNLVLFCASLVFYAWADLRHLPLLLFYIVFNYFAGLAIASSSRKAVVTVGSVSINVLLLIAFKYAGFIATEANLAFELFGFPTLPVPATALPLGISFFSFQGISYLIDIHRGDCGAQRNFIAFGMYKAMFPQLIAGPIVRYRMIEKRVMQRRTSAFRFRLGLQIFALGLAQKTLIANVVARPADQIFSLPASDLTLPTAWLGIACYTVQIFFDFAGYSNMAIGLAHLLGFRFPRNFNRPYVSQSLTEFWRRWHISLSSWFRDYVYRPLGGNRVSTFVTYRNLMIVFILCGAWHGANWTFVFWGLYNGAILMLERGPFQAGLAKLWRPLRHFYAITAIMVGFVFFRSNSIPDAFNFLLAMLGQGLGDRTVAPVAEFVTPTVMAALAAGVVFSTLPVRQSRSWLPQARIVHGLRWGLTGVTRDILAFSACLLLLAFSALQIAGGAYNPFIYYRF